MANINFVTLKKSLVGTKLPKPLSGTLSGHAAGEPFDKFVYAEIKKQFPGKTYRQYEYLNDLYLKNPKHISFDERKKLFESPTVLFLLSRGKDATTKWEVDNQFEEKQNDTADILVVDKNYYEIIDVKTRNISKKAQQPNIISAYKLAQMCAVMLDNKEFNTLGINYIEVDWKLVGNNLVCENAHYGSLFKENPVNLYINWAAAMQIQFHVSDLEQNYKKNLENWAKDYLRHFVGEARSRAKTMIDKFVKPFEKYLK